MMHQTWLMKTEPGVYSFDNLMEDGKTVWDGVSNPLALKHLRSMKKGDSVLIYHSGKERAIVGVAEVLSNPYPDPAKNNPRLVVVELKGKSKLKKPVSLERIKRSKEFIGFELIKLPRLSVMPVPTGLRNRVLKMAH